MAILSLLIGFLSLNWGYYSNTPCSFKESAVVGHLAGFYGEGINKVRIRNNGDIKLVPVPPVNPKIVTQTTAHGETKEGAFKTPYSLSQGDKHFELAYPLTIGGCPRQNTEVRLLDDANYGFVDYEAASTHGAITVTSAFTKLVFENFLAETSFGGVSVEQNIMVANEAKLFSGTGNIHVESMVATLLEARTSAGKVTLGNVDAAKIDLDVDQGDIHVAKLAMKQGLKPCRGSIEVTSGFIAIDELMFPSSGGCLMEINVVNGDVEVFVAPGFSGTYVVKSAEGKAYLDGKECQGSLCRGVYNEGVGAGHVLLVKSVAGKASLSLA